MVSGASRSRTRRPPARDVDEGGKVHGSEDEVLVGAHGSLCVIESIDREDEVLDSVVRHDHTASSLSSSSAPESMGMTKSSAYNSSACGSSTSPSPKDGVPVPALSSGSPRSCRRRVARWACQRKAHTGVRRRVGGSIIAVDRNHAGFRLRYHSYRRSVDVKVREAVATDEAKLLPSR